MLRKMRAAKAKHCKIVWGGEKPLWHTPLPAQLHDNETVHCFAAFATRPHSAPSLLWEADNDIHCEQARALVSTTEEALAVCLAWVAEQLSGAWQLSRHTKRYIRLMTKNICHDTHARIRQSLHATFPSLCADTWQRDENHAVRGRRERF